MIERRHGSTCPAAVLAAAALVVAAGASADVTLEQAFRVDAFGALSTLSAEGTVTTSIADRRLRSDNLVISQSGMTDHITRNPNGSTIVLLDEQRIITLVPAEQRYVEQSIEELRARLDYGTRVQDDAARSAEVLEVPVEEGECRWSFPDRNVIATGENQEFAGVKAEQYLVLVEQTCRVPDSGQVCDLYWHLESWNAERMPGQKEASDFRDELARQLGGEDVLSAAELSAGGLLALFRNGWNQVLTIADGIEGYPVKTVMTLEIGGEACGTGAGAYASPAAVEERRTDATVMQDIARETARTSAENTATNAAAQTAAQTVGGGLGGMIAGTAMSEAGRRLFDKFRRKQAEEEAAREAEAEAMTVGNPDDQSIMLFQVTTELLTLSKDRVPDARFAWPESWSKDAAVGTP